MNVDITKNDDIGASVGLEDDNDFFRWSVVFEGPSDTLYEGGFFKALLTFPHDYPNKPPEMKFVTIDFAGHGRSIVGSDIDSDPRNIVIAGYSDSILRLVNEVYVSQVDTVKEFANNLIEAS